MDTRHGRRDLFDRRIRVGQIGAKDERNFGFGFWLKSLCRIERAAIAHAHILEQHSEVGLVDAELRLHCLRGQPGLASDDSRSEEHTSELQSLMRIPYAVFCLKQNN